MYKKKAASKSIKKAMSYAQLLKRFPNEKACAEYLYSAKWPNGFVCPACGHTHGYALNHPGRYQCAKCRHQTSLTANTVMHRTYLPLTKWFWAICLVACDKRGISTLTLAGRICVSYETAWYLLRRIRMAMEARDAQYLLVESLSSMIPISVQKSREERGVEQEIRVYLMLLARTRWGDPSI